MRGDFSRHFSVKVFIVICAVVLGTTASLTLFHYRKARAGSEKALRERGVALARLLASQSRLGVFSENPELLRPAGNSLLNEPHVVAVSIFGDGPEPLFDEIRSTGRAATGCVSSPWNTAGPFPAFTRRPGLLAVVVPVTSGGWPDAAGAGRQDSRILGRVCIGLSTAAFRNELRALLLSSLAFAAFFVLTGLAAAWLVVRSITRPLRRLTGAVSAFGSGRPVDAVPVETKDEVGRLAKAFNEMAVSLLGRQAEKERLEEQLRHSQKMDALGRLTAGIAHDFNNTLTTIRCYERLLRIPGQGDRKVTAHAAAIGAAVDRGADSVQSLLTFSRKQSTEPAPVDLCALLRRMEGLFRRIFSDNIRIDTNLPKEPVQVDADEGQLEQVLVNLGNNARDAMGDGGVLALTLDRSPSAEDGGFARILLEDTGSGMDPDTLSSAMDPFFTTKPVGKGTGLGLSVAYGIVEQHRGHLTVESQSGRGTTVCILLPLPPERTGSGGKTAASPQSAAVTKTGG